MYLSTVFMILSFLLTLLFFLYGFNHYYLLGAACRYKTPGLLPGTEIHNPRVAIHLPIYNEKYVIHRLITACVDMAKTYGTDLVKIIIIDDSDDESVDLIDQEVAYYKASQIQIEIIRRCSRQGYKAGALQAALDRTEEEYIAIFDADFIPPPDFIVRSIPFLLQNENVGIVQGRWTHINRNYNVLTRSIAIGIDVHFLIEQTGRYAAGCFQNFNGSAGIIRVKALLQAGGWQADTLAEDLDASYRIQMQDYKTLYLSDLHCPGEVPPTIASYKKQQGRWACGSLRTAKKLLPPLLSNESIGLGKRLQAFIHLTGYLVHPLMFTSFVLSCLATLLRVDVFHIDQNLANLHKILLSGTINSTITSAPRDLIWSMAGLLIMLCTVAAWIPPFTILRSQPYPIPEKIFSFAILFLLGCGISLSNTIEAGKGLLTNRDWTFKRTPKYDIRYENEKWRTKSYQVALDYVSVLEFIFICLGGIAIASSIWNSNLGVLIILIPFTAAYFFVFSLTILQSRQERGI